MAKQNFTDDPRRRLNTTPYEAIGTPVSAPAPKKVSDQPKPVIRENGTFEAQLRGKTYGVRLPDPYIEYMKARAHFEWLPMTEVLPLILDEDMERHPEVVDFINQKHPEILEQIDAIKEHRQES